MRRSSGEDGPKNISLNSLPDVLFNEAIAEDAVREGDFSKQAVYSLAAHTQVRFRERQTALDELAAADIVSGDPYYDVKIESDELYLKRVKRVLENYSDHETLVKDAVVIETLFTGYKRLNESENVFLSTSGNLYKTGYTDQLKKPALVRADVFSNNFPNWAWKVPVDPASIMPGDEPVEFAYVAAGQASLSEKELRDQLFKKHGLSFAIRGKTNTDFPRDEHGLESLKRTLKARFEFSLFNIDYQVEEFRQDAAEIVRNWVIPFDTSSEKTGGERDAKSYLDDLLMLASLSTDDSNELATVIDTLATRAATSHSLGIPAEMEFLRALHFYRTNDVLGQDTDSLEAVGPEDIQATYAKLKKHGELLLSAQ